MIQARDYDVKCFKPQWQISLFNVQWVHVFLKEISIIYTNILLMEACDARVVHDLAEDVSPVVAVRCC